MTIQTVNLGAAPSGAGGDTFRSTGTKVNENFTNNTHAASRYVGLNDGNLVEKQNIGYAALTAKTVNLGGSSSLDGLSAGDCVFCDRDVGKPTNSPTYDYAAVFTKNLDPAGVSGRVQIAFDYLNSNQAIRTKLNNTWRPWAYFYTSLNTTVDSNGFIKKASPIAQLFADKIMANDEASEQNPIFEKVGVGHYLIKNTLGFAKEGWWIEVPVDSNGNRICAVEYQTLENGDLEIKTFKKKLNEEGDIVANLDMPIDIPNNANGEARWIDVRLHSIAKPVVRKVPRTEKQARMVQQVKYAPQLTYITKYEDLFDDAGNPVIVDGQKYQKPVTHIQTDKNGTPIFN
ncbi:MAG: hypothetical protein GAK29_03143 [Acinetobacter bereziniae]|uniref:Phage tail protein C-terminal domain-containing protein n=1 Tax=Acinetobacter bereziniae TaxID=106648 RepID=A0A833PDS7_ACIBZ|nr:MAG: hypothetical protein GAK29_03143 [Acinetobacter bereziniae]